MEKHGLSVKQDFFFDHQMVFRALRKDEVPSKGLLFPRNEHAFFSLQEHVEYGAICHTQFISFSSSLEQVAMYFAVKGALLRQEWPCRVVQVKLPVCGVKSLHQRGVHSIKEEGSANSDTIHDIMASVDDSWSEISPQLARQYNEICVESRVHYSLVEKMFEIQESEVHFFKDHLEDLRDFKAQYYKSSLNARFERPDDDLHVTITSRVV